MFHQKQKIWIFSALGYFLKQTHPFAITNPLQIDQKELWHPLPQQRAGEGSLALDAQRRLNCDPFGGTGVLQHLSYPRAFWKSARRASDSSWVKVLATMAYNMSLSPRSHSERLLALTPHTHTHTYTVACTYPCTYIHTCTHTLVSGTVLCEYLRG